MSMKSLLTRLAPHGLDPLHCILLATVAGTVTFIALLLKSKRGSSAGSTKSAATCYDASMPAMNTTPGLPLPPPLSPNNNETFLAGAMGCGRAHDAAKLLDFLLTVGSLKTQKRTGWVNHGVELPESIADHMYRLTLMGLTLTDSNVNTLRAALIGAVHDLAEAEAGDITPTSVSGVSKEEKHRLEVEGLARMLANFSAVPTVQARVRRLWEGYEYATTPEGKVVKQLDKLEMVIQAFEYERDQRMRLDAFFDSTRHSFTHPEAAALHREVLRRREELHQQWETEAAAPGGRPVPAATTPHDGRDKAEARAKAAAEAAAAAAEAAAEAEEKKAATAKAESDDVLRQRK